MTTNDTKPLVLVTGATGYIAGHCIRELLEHGYRVRGTVRSLRDPAKTEHLRRMATALGGSLDLVEADLTSDRGLAGGGRRLHLRAARGLAVSAPRCRRTRTS